MPLDEKDLKITLVCGNGQAYTLNEGKTLLDQMWPQETFRGIPMGLPENMKLIETFIDELINAGIITKENWQPAAKAISAFSVKMLERYKARLIETNRQYLEDVFDVTARECQGISYEWLERNSDLVKA